MPVQSQAHTSDQEEEEKTTERWRKIKRDSEDVASGTSTVASDNQHFERSRRRKYVVSVDKEELGREVLEFLGYFGEELEAVPRLSRKYVFSGAGYPNPVETWDNRVFFSQFCCLWVRNLQDKDKAINLDHVKWKLS